MKSLISVFALSCLLLPAGCISPEKPPVQQQANLCERLESPSDRFMCRQGKTKRDTRTASEVYKGQEFCAKNPEKCPP